MGAEMAVGPVCFHQRRGGLHRAEQDPIGGSVANAQGSRRGRHGERDPARRPGLERRQIQAKAGENQVVEILGTVEHGLDAPEKLTRTPHPG